MKEENIFLEDGVQVDPSSSLNNIRVGQGTKIAKRCSLFGAPGHLLEIGQGSYVGMNTLIEGFNARVRLGAHVSLAQNITILSGSGPNASPEMQRVYPIERGEVHIGDHTWIGTGSVIMPGVTLGRFCVVGVNSFVTDSFPDFSIVGGTPARLLRTFTPEEQNKILA